MYFKVCITWYC